MRPIAYAPLGVGKHRASEGVSRLALAEGGAIRVFTDVVSGKRFDRSGLADLIEHARVGDRTDRRPTDVQATALDRLVVPKCRIYGCVRAGALPRY